MSRSMRSPFSFQSSRPVFSKARLAATNSNVFLIARLDGTQEYALMPNPKMTFRIWTDAQAKLFEEMSHYRGDKPPFGQFISRLILMCPPELWKEVRARMDANTTSGEPLPWHSASAPPALRTLFQRIVVNRSLRDTKEQITMAEASRPTVTRAILQPRVARSRITSTSSVLRLARKLFRRIER